MHDPASPARHVRFGPFELDLRSGELRKGPTRLKVPDQSIEILKALLEQPGELVTREQLRERLWPSDHFVDFEHGLNAAVRRLREALGDSADTPTFIETLPRRGYRFVGTAASGVQSSGPVVEGHSGVQEPHTSPPVPQDPDTPRRRWTRYATAVAFAGLAVLLGVFVRSWVWRGVDSPVAPPMPEPTRLTFDTGLQAEPSFSPDGDAVAYSSDKAGNFDIWQQPLAGGNAVPVTGHPAHDWQPDWSPDGTEIVFRSERGGGGLFVVPATGGYERRISDAGCRPRWSADGTRILFRSGFRGNRLSVVQRDGTGGRELEIQGSDNANAWGEFDGADGWHPDGCVSLAWRLGGVVRLWTFHPDTGTLTRFLVRDSVQQAFQGQGVVIPARENLVWAPDGTAVYFVGLSKGALDIWTIGVDPRQKTVVAGPHRLTMGSGANVNLAVSRDGSRIAYSARTTLRRVWLFSLDASGKHITGNARAMTPAEVAAHTAALTSDGTKLLYHARRPGGRGRQELRERVLPDGPDRPLLFQDFEGGEARAFPRWSPDGTRIAYRHMVRNRAPGPGNPRGSEMSIKWFDTLTGKESTLTSSVPPTGGIFDEAAFGWSTDGRSVIASSLRYRPNELAIALIPLSAAPRAETQARVVTSKPGWYPWQASMSPDGRWICFNATRGGTSRIGVVSSKGGEWTLVTDGTSWADKPRWSADGRIIYFLTDEGGLGDVWGIEFDPVAGKPVGRPFAVTHFAGPGEQITDVVQIEIGVTRSHLAVPLVHATGGIWMLEKFRR